MARFNEILTGRYNRFLQKLLSMKGGPVAAQLGSEVSPALVFFSGVENRFLENWNRFGSGGQAASLAASFTQVQFRNPTGSNVIAVIERVSFSEVAADEVFLSMSTGSAALGTAQASRCLDNRATRGSTTTQAPSSGVFTGNVPVAGGVIARMRNAAGLDFSFIQDEGQEITVLPGDDLEITTATQNVALNFSFMWRERLMEESERF